MGAWRCDGSPLPRGLMIIQAATMFVIAPLALTALAVLFYLGATAN